MLGNSLAFALMRPVDPTAIKTKVEARGVGQGVRVTLSDKTEVKGLIVRIGEQSFAVKTTSAQQLQEIQFSQVTGVHNDKMSTEKKSAIVFAIVGVATVATGIIAAAVLESAINSDSPKNCAALNVCVGSGRMVVKPNLPLKRSRVPRRFTTYREPVP
jgi:hypothetical protein